MVRFRARLNTLSLVSRSEGLRPIHLIRGKKRLKAGLIVLVASRQHGLNNARKELFRYVSFMFLRMWLREAIAPDIMFPIASSSSSRQETGIVQDRQEIA